MKNKVSYLIIILFMPVMCQATMTAKEASIKTQKIAVAQNKERNLVFLSRIDGDISDAVDNGQCNTSIMAIDVSPAVIEKELKVLSKLGYIVKNDDQFLTVLWCQ